MSLDVPGDGGADRALLALRRRLEQRPKPRPGEACELCRQPLPDEHGHLVNIETRSLLCACRGCYLLFTPGGAGGRTYRAVPARYQRVDARAWIDASWEALQIPVGIAFFFFNTPLDRMVAFYPGPAGATESLLPLGAWEGARRADPGLGDLLPDVEALLVARRGGRTECFLVPIDACYELVGRMRRLWKGFDGGPEVAAEIDAFFAGLRARSEGPTQAGAPANLQGE